MFKLISSSFLLTESSISTKKPSQWVLAQLLQVTALIWFNKKEMFFHSIFYDHVKKNFRFYLKTQVNVILLLSSYSLFTPKHGRFIYQYPKCLFLLEIYLTGCLVALIIINFQKFDVTMWQVQNTMNWSGDSFYFSCNYF